MPDHAMGTLPRVALVFGDAAAVAHVREAMAGHADIAYAAPAAEFEVSRLVSAGATAALVNLDGGDWLEAIETELHAAGIAVVYNDPEISQALEGWERARWLRHLVAKLRGSRDVDPPRPGAVTRAAAAGPVAVIADPGIAQVVAAEDETAFAPAEDALEAAPPAAVVELPLSSEEIETMTVDFVGAPVSVPAPAIEPVAEAAGMADEPSEAVEHGMSRSFEPARDESAETSAASREPPDAGALREPREAFDCEAEAALDVDTEALSAMIDARLAEPASTRDQDSDQVWREVSGDAVAPVQQDEVRATGSLASDTRVAEPAPAPAAAEDDADVLASLPSLDDWALVDLDAAPAAAPATGARKSPEPVLSDAFAGLELVPMETIVPVRVDVEPADRWFGGDPAAAGANDAAGSKMKEVSHEHG